MHLIEVLRGKSGERTRRWGHDQLTVFGIGADLDEAEWRNVIRQLIALGFVDVDHSAHGALKLAEASRAVLKGEQTIQMRRAIAAKRKKPVSRSPAGAHLSPDDVILLDELKEWRKQEARTQGVPAYVILHDSSLTAIATSRPASLTALADIAGIGAKKLERYGAALIAFVRDNGAD